MGRKLSGLTDKTFDVGWVEQGETQRLWGFCVGFRSSNQPTIFQVFQEFCQSIRKIER